MSHLKTKKVSKIKGAQIIPQSFMINRMHYFVYYSAMIKAERIDLFYSKLSETENRFRGMMSV